MLGANMGFLLKRDVPMMYIHEKLNLNFQQTIKETQYYVSRVMRKPAFAYAKTKTQISSAVTALLISAFVFATQIVQFFNYPNMKFQVSSLLLWLYSPVCVGAGRKPRRPVFSQRGTYCVKHSK